LLQPTIDSIVGRWQRGASKMTCRELNDSLAEYTSGELAPERRRDFEGHLLDCGACAAYLRSYQRMVRETRSDGDLLDQLTSPDAPQELIDGILDATVRRGKSPRSR
jgi:anti-sigma factor RsiW